MANTTTSPSRPSTWWARSMRPSRRRKVRAPSARSRSRPRSRRKPPQKMARKRSHRRSSRKPPQRAARSRSSVADKLHVDIVTVEGRRFRGDADFVVAPGSEGELGVLPRHIPLLTPLAPGSVRVRNDGEEQLFFVSGGFLEVRPDQVTVLADSAERADDIDEARAEEARHRAESLLQQKLSDADQAAASAALARAEARLRLAELRRRRRV